ncbi:MAG: type II toxin-antitoxin system PemK/MazF family toxin [Chitinophagaceae bacterium]|nr:type II toxin-antitoxin system PemK/MazF family toxin [Chitinophagaceae bacterium]
MNTGDIVILSFPFTDETSFKARPAVIITETPDYNDTVVCLITSVIPDTLNSFQIVLQPDKINNLRAVSVIKVYRIATIENKKVLSVIGKLNDFQLAEFRQKFKSLVD